MKSRRVAFPVSSSPYAFPRPCPGGLAKFELVFGISCTAPHTAPRPPPPPTPPPPHPSPTLDCEPAAAHMLQGRRHWRQPLNRATPTLLPPATALALLWGERPPGRSPGRSSSGDALLQEIPTTGEDFQCPRPPPRKASGAPFCPTPPFKERMLGCWGGT